MKVLWLLLGLIFLCSSAVFAQECGENLAPGPIPAATAKWDGILVPDQIYWVASANRNCQKIANWSYLRRNTTSKFIIFVGKEFTCNDESYILGRDSRTDQLFVFQVSSLELNPTKFP